MLFASQFRLKQCRASNPIANRWTVLFSVSISRQRHQRNVRRAIKLKCALKKMCSWIIPSLLPSLLLLLLGTSFPFIFISLLIFFSLLFWLLPWNCLKNKHTHKILSDNFFLLSMFVCMRFLFVEYSIDFFFVRSICFVCILRVLMLTFFSSFFLAWTQCFEFFEIEQTQHLLRFLPVAHLRNRFNERRPKRNNLNFSVVHMKNDVSNR